MSPKTVLVVGASGLVGYAAMKHFASDPTCKVIAVSRRRPDDTFGARFVAADLTDARSCSEIFGAFGDVTHVIYAALYERPGLIAGWRDEEQIAINDRMLQNVMEPLEKAARGLAHVCLLQGTKAYGSHVRPMKVPAREGRSEMREQPNFYWNQEDYLREKQRGKGWCFSIFRPVLIVGYSQGSAMNVIPAIGVYAAMLKEAGQPLHYPGGPPRVGQAVDADLLARCMAWAVTRAPHATKHSTSPTATCTAGRIFGQRSLTRWAWRPAMRCHAAWRRRFGRARRNGRGSGRSTNSILQI